jgi:hypothetical protein
MKVKETYFGRRKVVLKCGNITTFWLDPWLSSIPLCDSHPQLFEISMPQHASFTHVLNVEINIPFTRRLCPGNLLLWNEIKTYIAQMSFDPDIVVWSRHLVGFSPLNWYINCWRRICMVYLTKRFLSLNYP